MFEVLQFLFTFMKHFIYYLFIYVALTVRDIQVLSNDFLCVKICRIGCSQDKSLMFKTPVNLRVFVKL